MRDERISGLSWNSALRLPNQGCQLQTRVLMRNGRWLVPKEKRPADWKERMKPQELKTYKRPCVDLGDRRPRSAQPESTT